MNTIKFSVPACWIAFGVLLTGGSAAHAAAVFNGSYSQDFNILASGPLNSVHPWTDDSTIVGVHAHNDANPTIYITGSTSYINTIQALGGEDASDRALVSTNNGGGSIGRIGIQLTNNTGSPISTISVGYTAEQWYVDGSGSNSELDFHYSLNATSLTSGTYVAVSALDAIAPNPQPGSSTRAFLDGNDPANQVQLASTFDLASAWSPGTDLWLRWTSPPRSSFADGFAVDDVSVSVVPEPSALALAACGLIGLAAWGYRRRASFARHAGA